MSISKKSFGAPSQPPALDVARTMLYRSDMDEKVVERIRRARLAAGLSQNDLAVQVGTTNMSINRLSVACTRTCALRCC